MTWLPRLDSGLKLNPIPFDSMLGGHEHDHLVRIRCEVYPVTSGR